MAWSAASIYQAAFKKLFGLSHTEVKDFPLGNEGNPSQLTIISKDVYTDSIPTEAAEVADQIVACTNSTDAQENSYLTVVADDTLAPNGAGEGIPYLIKVPASHGLIGEINPLTGAAYEQGDVVQSIIPKKFGTTWRPILYDATKTEIPPLSSLDWFMDERGFVIIRDNSSVPTYLKCWVYVGKTVDNKVTGVSCSRITVSADAPANPTTGDLWVDI